MPANPEHVGRREVLSEDYHDEKARIDFYTNSAIAIYRGDQNEPKRVWLDNLEKRELLKVLQSEIGGNTDE
jgi:hypothetical protein